MNKKLEKQLKKKSEDLEELNRKKYPNEAKGDEIEEKPIAYIRAYRDNISKYEKLIIDSMDDILIEKGLDPFDPNLNTSSIMWIKELDKYFKKHFPEDEELNRAKEDDYNKEQFEGMKRVMVQSAYNLTKEDCGKNSKESEAKFCFICKERSSRYHYY